MNFEKLGRQAVDIIKEKWGLPSSGFLAGGSIANIIWELVSGNKAVVNDIDIFIYNKELNWTLERSSESLFRYNEAELEYKESYNGFSYTSRIDKEFYEIVESKREDMWNYVYYNSNTTDPNLILRSFDINATRVGYSISEDKFYFCDEFIKFLKTGDLKVINARTPAHTAIRICKKQKELNCKLNEFEYEILKLCLNSSFKDNLKIRFTDKYLKVFLEYKNILGQHFSIQKDDSIKQYLLTNFNKDLELFILTPNSNSIFNNKYLKDIEYNEDFIFYVRNIYGNDELSEKWNKLKVFFKDFDYLDIDIMDKDIEILSRLIIYAPKSINHLRGYNLSKQLLIVNTLLDKYKDDPIIAISILEKFKIDDPKIDNDQMLIMELAVRREILNDYKNKVNKIIHNKIDIKKVYEYDDSWI